MRRGGEEEKNLVIFLICAFLVALSIHAGVLIKQTVKLFSKTVLYSSWTIKQIQLFIYFKYISLSMVHRSIPRHSTL